MNKLSEISLYLLAWCCLLSIFGKNLRHEKDTPGKGELLYVDILLWINSNFIKWIWGWTMLLITPFSILVTYNLNYFEAVCLAKKNLVHKSSASKQVASSKNLKKLAFFTPSVLLHPIVRINFLGTVIWYLFTLLKRVIFNNSGRCLIENSNKAILQASSSQACRLLSTDHLKNKIVDSYWSGFNLSGHNFMINFCLMVVLHECYGFYLVHEKYAGKIQAQNSSKNNPFHHPKTQLHFTILKYYYYLILIYIYACLSMVTVTYLLYHTFLEKIFGTILALFAWQIIYYDVCCRLPKASKYGFLKLILAQPLISRLAKVEDEKSD